MVEYFKELVAAANSRVRSPVLGSIALVFFALNWKEIFYVLVADTSVQIRLSYFEVNTDQNSLVVYPILGGISFALCLPWVNFLGSFFARIPVRLLKSMQGDEQQLLRLSELKNAAELEHAKARLEQEKEQRVLDAAERLKKANEISPDTAADLQENRSTEPEELSLSHLEVLGTLDEYGTEVLLGLARAPKGIGAIFESSLGEVTFKFLDGTEPDIVIGDHVRKHMLFYNEIAQMVDFGLISVRRSNRDLKEDLVGEIAEELVAEYRILEFGYEIAEKLGVEI